MRGADSYSESLFTTVKLEDFVPAKANKWLFTLAPLMAIIPVFVTFAIVPFGSTACPHQSRTISRPRETRSRSARRRKT